MKKIGVLFVLLTALCVNSYSQSGYNVGDYAADFQLKDVSGETVSLADFDDAKGYIVVFTCNHCPYAIAYEDRVIGLNEEFAPQGFPVIAINPNDPAVQPEDSFEKMQVRATEKGFTFPYVFDEEQAVYPIYGATRTPHVFVLEKLEDGNIVRYIGAIDDNYEDASAVNNRYVANAVNAILEGKSDTIDPSFTKAIGCTIKSQK